MAVSFSATHWLRTSIAEIDDAEPTMREPYRPTRHDYQSITIRFRDWPGVRLIVSSLRSSSVMTDPVSETIPAIPHMGFTYFVLKKKEMQPSVRTRTNTEMAVQEKEKTR